jgi:hypothetical protein
VIDAGRHEHGVHRFELGGLDAGPQARAALDYEVEFIGAAVLASRFLLLSLKANELRHEAQAVENVDTDWALAQEMPRSAEVNYIHSMSG